MQPRSAHAVVLVAAAAVACGPIPGGVLEGERAEAPPVWTEAIVEEAGFCEVESRSRAPHSVQLYCFVHEGALYAQSHRWAMASWWPATSWARIWMEHPEVRLRLGSALFDLTAVHVEDSPERTAAIQSTGYDPVPPGMALFRFDRRD